MQSKTLLFYINAINGGGAERVILEVAQHFAEAGYRAVLVTSFVDPQYEYPVPPGVIRLFIEQEQIQQSRIRRNISRIAALRKICKKEKPKAVISFMAEPNFRAILSTLGLPIKTVVSVRNDPNREYAGRVGRIVGKYFLPMANGCVFQTEDAKAWFPKRLQKKSAVIMNAVAEPFFEVQRKNARDVVAVGRLNVQKNHEMLVRAFAKVADKHPEQNLLIYGKGDQENALRQLISALGLEKRVLLKGATAQVPQVLENAGVFVLSSDYEGMPNALLEAMAAGVPSISTDCPCGGPAMLIRHGENGLLVPVGDEEAMAIAMDRMLSNVAFAEKLSSAARIDAEAYRPEKVFKLWQQYVEGIVNG